MQQLHVDFLQLVGRPVVVGHRTLARQPLGHRVQFGLQPVIRPLLPVARAGFTGSGPRPIGHRALKPLPSRHLQGSDTVSLGSGGGRSNWRAPATAAGRKGNDTKTGERIPATRGRAVHQLLHLWVLNS